MAWACKYATRLSSTKANSRNKPRLVLRCDHVQRSVLRSIGLVSFRLRRTNRPLSQTDEFDGSPVDKRGKCFPSPRRPVTLSPSAASMVLRPRAGRPWLRGPAMLTTSVRLVERLRRPEDAQACARLVELYPPLLFRQPPCLAFHPPHPPDPLPHR